MHENGAIYVRQSSPGQIQNNVHSFEMQTDKFVEHFRNKGCTGVIEIIADDEGKSGTLDIHNMTGMTRIMRLIEGKELIKGKRIGWIAAVHVNRLTRDKWLVKPGTIMKECYENDIWLATLRMDFNFQDEYCQRVFMLEAEESARHLEWMKLVLGGGKAVASSNGYYDGRWIVPGYIVDRLDPKKKKYIIYGPHAEVVRWLFRRYLELDGNLYALCREVDSMPFLFPEFEKWVDPRNIAKFGGKRAKIKGDSNQEGYKSTASGIRNILCNPVYIGWWIPINGGLVVDNHEPITDEGLFTYAHKRLSRYGLNGEKQKPEKYLCTSKTEGILKNVLHDACDTRMYAISTFTRGKGYQFYKSQEKKGLVQDFHYAVNLEVLDAGFLTKLFERMEVLEKLDGWEDKLTERLEAKKKSQEYQKNLLQKQIKQAEARWKEMFDTINDPEIPKTKQMKIEYATSIAGLENKIADLKNQLAIPDEGEEDETILYEIHSLLPDIASKWLKISFTNRLRFVKALVKKVVVTVAAPSWFKVEVYWKNVIGDFIDVGYLKRTYTNRTDWSEDEKETVRRLYPKADILEILNALPDRSWSSIETMAHNGGVIRNRGKMPNSVSIKQVHTWGTLEDLKCTQEHNINAVEKSMQWCHPSSGLMLISRT